MTNEVEREEAIQTFLRCETCDFLALRDAIGPLLLDRQRLNRLEAIAKRQGQIVVQFNKNHNESIRSAIDELS